MQYSRISREAVDVVPDSAGADQAFVIVGGCYAAYRKAVSFVSIWHGDCVFANPVEVRDVYALLDGPIGSHLGEKLFVGVDSRRDFHSRLEVSWDLPYVRLNLGQRNLCA